METQMCFQCLQRRIELDFSVQFIFCYGLSDSPLPFGSTAVVQIIGSLVFRHLPKELFRRRCLHQYEPTITWF
ncbi:hypothetical protein P3S67_018093 [Capsicum chacoense]